MKKGTILKDLKNPLKILQQTSMGYANDGTKVAK